MRTKNEQKHYNPLGEFLAENVLKEERVVFGLYPDLVRVWIFPWYRHI